MHITAQLFLWVVVILLWIAVSVDAEAHPHEGKVVPFAAGDPKVKLDRKAQTILKSGRPYQTQIQTGSSGRGLVVQDVKAPTSIVWDRILDYNNYAKMVPKTLESANYKVEKHRDGSQTIYTRMKVGFSMIKLTFYVKHEYLPRQNSLTWTLDYSRKSDFDDSCGYWYVIPHPDDPKHSARVYYSVEVSMFDWVPHFVVNFMSSRALTDATGWVKKYSELKYEQEGGASEAAASKMKSGWFLFRAQPEGEDDDNEEVSEEETEVMRKTPSAIGLTRYALVTSVVSLLFYNVHLYFSQ